MTIGLKVWRGLKLCVEREGMTKFRVRNKLREKSFSSRDGAETSIEEGQGSEWPKEAAVCLFWGTQVPLVVKNPDAGDLEM